MERFLHLIVNQQSRKSDQVFKKLLVEIPKYTQHYKIYVTETPEKLKELIKGLKSAMDAEDLVIVIGGDGSLNHLVTLFEKYHLDNYIGYIPAGSGNDFARSHKMPLETEQAIQHLFYLKEPKEVSIIQAVQGDAVHYAVNSIGIGIDGLVSHQVSLNRLKKQFGAASYLSGILSAFFKQNKFPLTIQVDEGIYSFAEVQLILIANNPYFAGGIKIAPEADGLDDSLEVLIANDVTAANLVSILRKVTTDQSHLSHPKFHHFTTKHLAVYIDAEEYAQKDGDFFKQKGFAWIVSTKKRKFWI